MLGLDCSLRTRSSQLWGCAAAAVPLLLQLLSGRAWLTGAWGRPLPFTGGRRLGIKKATRMLCWGGASRSAWRCWPSGALRHLCLHAAACSAAGPPFIAAARAQ